jgi:hypothetical protein
MDDEEKQESERINQRLQERVSDIFSKPKDITTTHRLGEFDSMIQKETNLISGFIEEVERGVNKRLKEGSRFVAIGRKKGISENDPYFRACAEYREVIGSILMSITWRSMTIEILNNERKHLISQMENLITKTSDTTSEKSLEDLYKERLDSVQKKQDELVEKLMDLATGKIEKKEEKKEEVSDNDIPEAFSERKISESIENSLEDGSELPNVKKGWLMKVKGTNMPDSNKNKLIKFIKEYRSNPSNKNE